MRKDYDYDYEDDYEQEEETRGLPLGVIGAAVVAGVAIGAAIVFGVLPAGSDGDDDQVATASDNGEVAEPADQADQPTEPEDAGSEPPETASEPADDDANEPAEVTEQPGDSQAPGLDDDADGNSQTADPSEDSEPVVVDAEDATVPTTLDAAGEPTAEPGANQPSYPVLPDGSPVPVLGIYDGELITLSGVVPSEAAADRLRTLAIAFSKVPDAEIASFITIDPTMPANVGVRVIEMNSIRFPEGTPAVSAEHALELDRVALMMTALPQVTTLVIGHADQRGDSDVNFKLSADRARAAADYIASQGVDPTRLSSRGAGESDLLTLNNDAAALALNRRTEFVVSGLLVDTPPPVEDQQP